MVQDTVNVPISLMIWLGGLIIGLLGTMFSFSGHLLISIRSSLASITTKMAVTDAMVEARLGTLERHDTRNEEDRRNLSLWQTRQQE